MSIRKRSSGATLHDVARDAGVSFSAVSKALRGVYGVSDSMRVKVQASADRLGYRPHAAARGMRGKTYTIGVLISDLHNPFFSEVFAGITDEASKSQYQAMLGVGYVSPVTENAVIDSMIDRQVDGMLLIAPSMSPADIEIVADEVPTVLIGVHLPAATTFDTVNNDDEVGARLAVRHLNEQGYSNIAFLTLHNLLEAKGTTLEFREAGYRSEMFNLGLGENIQVIGASMESGEIRSAALRLLTGKRRPEAIFCWTDYVAFEVIGVAHQLGLKMPDDLAIVSYDNTPFCALPQHSLTSVDQSGHMLGQKATRLLLDRIGGRNQAEHFTVTPSLFPRDSTLSVRQLYKTNG